MKKITNLFLVTILLGGIMVLPNKSLAHGIDSVVKTSDNTVYFITNEGGTVAKRPFTSFGSLQSYGFLSTKQIVTADAEDLSFSTGEFIPPKDGSIFCATETKGTDIKGECSLITGGEKAAFTSAGVFAEQGYDFAKAFYGDSSFLVKTTDIADGKAAHRFGSVVNQSGTLYYVEDEYKFGIPSMAVLNSWGWSLDNTVFSNANDNLRTEIGTVKARQPGQIGSIDVEYNDTGEGIILLSVFENYPDYPTAKYSSSTKLREFKDFYNDESGTSLPENYYDFLTEYSQTILDLLPRYRKVIEQSTADPNVVIKNEKFALYGDGTYAVVTADEVDYGKTTEAKLFFIKEHGSWKLDLIASVKWHLANQDITESQVIPTRPLR